MHPSRLALLLFVSGALAATSTPAWAEAQLFASQNARCTPSSLDLELTPDVMTFTHFTMYVSGQEPPVGSYTIATTIRAADGGALPDAWRFDAGGCQPANYYELSTFFIVDPVLICPFLGGGTTWGPHQKTIAHDPITGTLRLTTTMTYNMEMTPRDPARSYLIAHLYVDHTSSVNGSATVPGTCGGVERGVCIAIEGAWTDLAGVEHAWPAATPYVTVNAPGAACSAVPAAATTWGAIKGQYR